MRLGATRRLCRGGRNRHQTREDVISENGKRSDAALALEGALALGDAVACLIAALAAERLVPPSRAARDVAARAAAEGEGRAATVLGFFADALDAEGC